MILVFRLDTGKVGNRFGGMVRFKAGLRCRINSIIIDVITYINYRCINMQVFF